MSVIKAMHPRPHPRTEEMNDNVTSVQHNLRRIEAAKEEVQTPIMNIINSVRGSIAGLFKGVKNLAADLITNPIALAANTVRWGWDVATKIPARLIIGISDTLGEKTFGKISKWMGKINEKIHGAFEGKGHGHGNGHGGHGDGHAAHGGGHDAHGGGHGGHHGPRDYMEIKESVEHGEKLGGHGHH